MKNVSSILIIIILIISIIVTFIVLCFVACDEEGRSSKPPPKEEAAPGQGSGTTPGSEQEGEEDDPGRITVKEKIVYDNEGLVITLKGFTENEEDRIASWPKFQFLVENGTSENLRIRTTESSVNGVMVNSYMMCEIGPEEWANAEMGLFSTDLKRANIEIIKDVEFIFHFIGEQSAIDYRYSDVISIRTSADYSYVQTYDDSGGVLVNRDGIKIVNQGLYYESDTSGLVLNLFIANNSGSDVRVMPKSCYIDGVLIEIFAEAVVLDGKKAFTVLTFEEEDLLSNGIEDAELLEIVFEISGAKSYSLIFDSEEIRIGVSAEGT